MSFIKDLQIGLSSYGKAVDFIFTNRLYYFFLIPIALNILLFSISYYFVSNITIELIDYLKASWNPEEWDFWGASILAGTIGVLIWLILRILFFLLFAFIGGYVILILLSPVLAYVSEKTEQIMNGNQIEFSWKQLFKDMLRGILLAIRNFLIEISLVIVLFVLSFFPLIGFATAPILFLISAYFYGFSFMDYNLERRKMNIKESVDFTRRNKGLAIANGSLFALALLIPFIGVSLSGFLAIISTVAATLALLKKEAIVTTR